MAAYDLSAQLRARQQAYRLAVKDRGEWQTWMQRLLAGINDQPAPAPAPAPVTPPAGGTTPPATGNPAHAARIAALQKVLAAVQQHSAQYAANPQSKALMDQMVQRLTQRIAALQAGTGQGPGVGGWGDWLKNMLGGGAAGGTPVVPGAGAADAGGTGAGEGGATGWLGDLLKGFTTPVTTPRPAVVPPVVPPVGGVPVAGAPGTPGGGTAPADNPYATAENNWGQGAQWTSDPYGGPGQWQPPEQPAAQPEPVAVPGPTGATQAQLDAWKLAAETDFQYEANLLTAARKEADPNKRAALEAKAAMYDERGQKYIARVPGYEVERKP